MKQSDETLRRPYPWLQGLLLFLLLGVVAAGALALSDLEDQLVGAGGASLSLAATEVADELDQSLLEHYTVLKTVAKQVGLQNRRAAVLRKSLSSIRQASPDTRWAAITDQRGRVIAATDITATDENQGQSEWFQAVRAGAHARVDVVPVNDRAVDGGMQHTLAMAVPIMNRRGEFSGAVVTLLEPVGLEQLVLDAIRSVESRVSFSEAGEGRFEYEVITSQGMILLESNREEPAYGAVSTLETESVRLSASGEPGFVEESRGQRNVQVVTGYARTEGFPGFKELDWIVLVRTDRDVLAAPVHNLRWKLGLSFVLVGFPVVGFLLWMSGRLQRDYTRVYQESVNAKLAERTLSEREERARQIVDTALDALVSIDEEGRIIDWNARAEHMFGWTREEAIGRPLLSTIMPRHYGELQELGLRQLLATGDAPMLNKLMDVTASRRDGHEFPAELTMSPARIGDRVVVTVFVRDITERKQRDRRLAVQYAVTRVLSESTSIEEAGPRLLQTLCEHLEWQLGIFWTVDQQARVLRVVDVWHVAGMGLSDFAEACQRDVVPPGAGLTGQVWARGTPIWAPEVLKQSNGPRAATAVSAGLHSAFAFPIRVGDTILGVLEFFCVQIREPDQDLNHMVVDIGVKVGQLMERKRAEVALRETEEQLRQSQKMEAIGRLAGGVAHDFNNLLTVITGYTQLLLGRLNPDDPMRGEVEEIKKAGSRAAALTGQLLAFSRRQAISPQSVNLNTVVSNMEGMLRRLLGEDIIEFSTVQAPDLGMIKADAGQLDQVVMNLAVNACDAMPQGGKLTIETANVTVSRDAVRGGASLEPGSYVVLKMSDDGCGMSEETMSHVFEPFFTTKEKGKGTGLGLSTVYGIVKQNGGHVTVDSQLGLGTTFRIYFPRVDVRETETERSPVSLDTDKAGETILIVEDEPAVRGLVREMLKQRGYTVLEARDGINAQIISKGHLGPIDLLLTDVVMPQKSGPEAAKELLLDRPDMKVLYMSGYPDHPVFSSSPLDKTKLLLQKPFTPESLVQKVREILDMPQGEFRSSHLVG